MMGLASHIPAGYPPESSACAGYDWGEDDLEPLSELEEFELREGVSDASRIVDALAQKSFKLDTYVDSASQGFSHSDDALECPLWRWYCVISFITIAIAAVMDAWLGVFLIVHEPCLSVPLSPSCLA